MLFQPAEAVAQSDWPKAKPIRMLVGFAPGSTTDIVARILSHKVGEISGGTFVVENKPGAGGNIATGQVKRAAADGYTVLAHSWIRPTLKRNLHRLAWRLFITAPSSLRHL